MPALNVREIGGAGMDRPWVAVLVTVGFSALGALGDYFLKIASAADSPLRTRAFAVGFVVYASTAFGWLFVMRHLKLATISAVYSVSMILILTGVGAAFFGETPTRTEAVGLGLAVVSLVLLLGRAG
jgi:drug/metabolite transporter (DMT)-like permease